VDAQLPLANRCALVTGGGRGIGRGIALALAGAGADVAVAARTEHQVAAVAAEIRACGRRGTAFAVDVARPEEIGRLFAQASEAFGGLDILVTAAGFIIRKPAIEFTLTEWDALLAVNLRARFLCSQEAARLMRQRGGGKIIHVGSLSMEIVIPGQLVYAVGNGGVRQMTRALAVEWAPWNIQVNAIAPGTFLTEQTRGLLSDPEARTARLRRVPLGRLGEAERDVGGAAVFLASPAADYVTGHVLVVDGGTLAAY
jgi:NAD(P)-dependent dehydrogenase (short-subunit alcohol dehydrogenase family)